MATTLSRSRSNKYAQPKSDFANQANADESFRCTKSVSDLKILRRLQMQVTNIKDMMVAAKETWTRKETEIMRLASPARRQHTLALAGSTPTMLELLK